MSSMTKVCVLDELLDSSAREFSLGGGDWPLRGFVVRYQNQIRAYVNSCPHAEVQLNFKPDVFFAPTEPFLLCTVHGALFEPLTGACVAGPCVGKSLRELQVEVRDGCIYICSQPEDLKH